MAQRVQRLDDIDGVPVRLCPQKRGTPIIKFGVGRQHTSSFRLDECDGAPDVVEQVRAHPDFASVRSALTAGTRSRDRSPEARRKRSRSLSPERGAADDAGLFGCSAEVFAQEATAAAAPPRQRCKVKLFSFAEDQLRNNATGRQRRKRPATDCQDPACMQLRDEHRSFKRKLESQTSAMKQLASELEEMAADLKAGEATALHHMQLVRAAPASQPAPLRPPPPLLRPAALRPLWGSRMVSRVCKL